NAEAAAPEPHSELERRQKQRRKDRAGSRSLLPGLASRHVCSGRTLYHHRCTPMQSFSQVSRPAKRGCDVIIREVPHHLAGGIHAVSKRTLAFLTTLMILGSARLSFSQNEAAEADSGSQVVMIVGDRKITASEFEKITSALPPQFQDSLVRMGKRGFAE